jgi:hypothetical protein
VKKQLTEAQAWRAIAEKLLTQGYVQWGLCKEVARITVRTEDEHLYAPMTARLEAHLHSYPERYGAYNPGEGEWAFPRGECHEERALAALWMALEAEEEARA